MNHLRSWGGGDIWRGKPSPRGYCVRRYPIKREVSRNALNFQSPLSRPRHSLHSGPGQSPQSRHFSDVRQQSTSTCLSSPKRARPARHRNRLAWHRYANGKPGDSTAPPLAAPLLAVLRRCLPSFPRGFCSLIPRRADFTAAGKRCHRFFLIFPRTSHSGHVAQICMPGLIDPKKLLPRCCASRRIAW